MPSKPLGATSITVLERSLSSNSCLSRFSSFPDLWTPALPALQYKAFMAQGRCHWFPTEIHSYLPHPPHTHCT